MRRVRPFVVLCIAALAACYSPERYRHESAHPVSSAVLDDEQAEVLQTLRARADADPGNYQAQKQGKQLYKEIGSEDYRHAGKKALEKWQDWKYGLRIHWGVYSILGVEASMTLCGASDEYQKLYHTLYQVFNPTDFDPDEWMALMKRGGMKYFTFTTKHADGFCMWPTKTTQRGLQAHWKRNNGKLNFNEVVNHYSIEETPYKKDIVKMLVDAARRSAAPARRRRSERPYSCWASAVIVRRSRPHSPPRPLPRCRP